MDLSAFTQSDTFELVVKDPITGEDTDVKIELYSSDSKHYRAALAELAGSESDGGIGLLSMLTKGWENVQFNGKSLACNKENAAMIYSKVPFLYAAAEKVIFNRVNFMQSLAEKH